MSDDEPTAILFTDGAGSRWEVRELQSPGLQSIAAEGMALPEFRNGWLLFTGESGERRRLAPFPADWRKLTAAELAALTARARRVSTPDVQGHADGRTASIRR